MVNKKSKKLESLLWFGIGVTLIILFNVIANQYFFRVDLTEENRYSITEATKEALETLDDVVYVEVYLAGSFPAGFKRLQNSVRESLEEFRVYGGANIQFEFIDPSSAAGNEAKNEFYTSLVEKGIQPTNLFATEDGKKIEKLIFPGAIVSYGGEETALMLLKGNQAATPEERLTQSIEGVEYELISAIKKLAVQSKKKIALIRGHGELDSLDIAGMTNILLEFYEVFHVDLREKQDLASYDAIVVAKPDTTFSEADKYKIDQFIMNGGKAMFFIESMRVNMDSAGEKGTVAFPYQLNLEDLFFRYGARLNGNLIQDLNSGAHPVVTGFMGDQPQIRVLPWPYYPIINYFGNHPIVKNIDAVYGRFVSSIDTVKAEGILKTPLFYTSQYSRVLAAPVLVSLNSMREDVVPENFTSGPIPVAYMLEGSFSSLYKNRIIPTSFDKQTFKEQGLLSKILIVADGDFIRNEINYQNGTPYKLGFDPYMNVAFANEDFLLNAMSYLLDGDGIIMARVKEVKIRPLDKLLLQNEALKWQLINLLLPLFMIVIFGVLRYYYRKTKYSNKTKN